MSRKLMVLALLAVLALGTLGAAYTYWGQIDVIGALVTTGTFDVDIVNPTATVTNPNTVSTCTLTATDQDSVALNIGLAMPGWGCTIGFDVENTGNIPAKFDEPVFFVYPPGLGGIDGFEKFASYSCDVDGITLDPGDSVACSITYAIPASVGYADQVDTPDYGESLSGSVTLTLTSHQWNAVP